MTLEEANNIIQAYMDYDKTPTKHMIEGMPTYELKRYDQSLDSLVDVWKKLSINMNLSYQPNKGKFRCRVWEYNKSNIYKETKPPQQYSDPNEAACISTARAITALSLE